MSEQPAPYAGILARDIERANERLDWIEQRDGPLPDANFATIETTVGTVRALRGKGVVEVGLLGERVAELADANDRPERQIGVWQNAAVDIGVKLAASERRVAALTAAGEGMLDLLTGYTHGVVPSDPAIAALRGDWLFALATGHVDPDESDVAEGAPSDREGA